MINKLPNKLIIKDNKNYYKLTETKSHSGRIKLSYVFQTNNLKLERMRRGNIILQDKKKHWWNISMTSGYQGTRELAENKLLYKLNKANLDYLILK